MALWLAAALALGLIMLVGPDPLVRALIAVTRALRLGRWDDGGVHRHPELLDLRLSEDAPDAPLAAVMQIRHEEDVARAEHELQEQARLEARERYYEGLRENVARLDAEAKAEAEARQLARVERLMAGELTAEALTPPTPPPVELPTPYYNTISASGVFGTVAAVSSASYSHHLADVVDEVYGVPRRARARVDELAAEVYSVRQALRLGRPPPPDTGKRHRY